MEDLIFFLKLEKELPKWYYQFSLHLSELGQKLVPVTMEEFWKLIQTPKQYPVIVPLVNLNSKQKFGTKVQSLFEKTMKNSKIIVFHLTSFYDDSIQKKWKRYPSYFYYELPAPIDELALKIAKEMHRINEEKVKYAYGIKNRVRSSNILSKREN